MDEEYDDELPSVLNLSGRDIVELEMPPADMLASQREQEAEWERQATLLTQTDDITPLCHGNSESSSDGEGALSAAVRALSVRPRAAARVALAGVMRRLEGALSGEHFVTDYVGVLETRDGRVVAKVTDDLLTGISSVLCDDNAWSDADVASAAAWLTALSIAGTSVYTDADEHTQHENDVYVLNKVNLESDNSNCARDKVTGDMEVVDSDILSEIESGVSRARSRRVLHQLLDNVVTSEQIAKLVTIICTCITSPYLLVLAGEAARGGAGRGGDEVARKLLVKALYRIAGEQPETEDSCVIYSLCTVVTSHWQTLGAAKRLLLTRIVGQLLALHSYKPCVASCVGAAPLLAALRRVTSRAHSNTQQQIRVLCAVNKLQLVFGSRSDDSDQNETSDSSDSSWGHSSRILPESQRTNTVLADFEQASNSATNSNKQEKYSPTFTSSSSSSRNNQSEPKHKRYKDSGAPARVTRSAMMKLRSGKRVSDLARL